MIRGFAALPLVLSLSALAQTPTAPPSPPPSTAPAVAPAPVEAAPTTEPMRVRGGLGTGVGTFIPGPMFSIGLEARIGLQVNRMFGAYVAFDLIAGLGIGGSVSATGASVSLAAVGLRQVALLGDLTLGDAFFVSLGGVLANGGWAGVTSVADSSGKAQATAIAAGGWLPGAHAKIGIGFGGNRRDAVSGRRSGLTLSLDGTLLFGTQTAQASAGTEGVGIAVGQTLVGFAPMLMLGYEWK